MIHVTIGQIMGSLRKKKNKNTIADIEKAMIDTCSMNVNMCVPWYLMAAYAYYIQDDPILEDHMFDRMAKKILANYEAIEHFHKHLLTKDDLRAGTFLGEYPSRVQGAVDSIRGD